MYAHVVIAPILCGTLIGEQVMTMGSALGLSPFFFQRYRGLYGSSSGDTCKPAATVGDVLRELQGLNADAPSDLSNVADLGEVRPGTASCVRHVQWQCCNTWCCARSHSVTAASIVGLPFLEAHACARALIPRCCRDPADFSPRRRCAAAHAREAVLAGRAANRHCARCARAD
jgi:hypothetical protein